MNGDSRITSESYLHERLEAISENLRALDRLLEDVVALRTRFVNLDEEMTSVLASGRSQIAGLEHQQSAVEELLASQRDSVASFAVLRTELEAALGVAKSTSDRLTSEFQQQREQSAERLETGLKQLHVALDTAVQKLSTTTEEWQHAFSERQARQLDDVLRAYELLSARQQEAERAATVRADRLEQALGDHNRSFSDALTMVERGVNELRESSRTELRLLERRLVVMGSTAIGTVALLLFVIILFASR